MSTLERAIAARASPASVSASHWSVLQIQRDVCVVQVWFSLLRAAVG